MDTVKAKAKAEAQITQWLSDRPSWIRQVQDATRAKANRRRPVSIRYWGLLHWATKTGMASSAPAVMYYFYHTITLITAGGAAFILFLGNGLVAWLDVRSRSKSEVGSAADEFIWMRVGDLVTSISSAATHPDHREQSIESTLGLIEGYVRLKSKSPSGDISVTLVLYGDGDRTEMLVRYRNPGNARPTGRTVRSLDVFLGHRACESGLAPRVVNDLRRFPRIVRASPTQSNARYRSIMFIPVASAASGQIKGFVSIDSPRPYTFYGKRGDDVLVTCEPLLSHISELL